MEDIDNRKSCSADIEALKQIAQVQDRKIKAYLAEKRKTHFFYASYLHKGSTVDFITKVHSMGFDNYPVAEVYPNERWFFLERLMGCNIRCLDGKSYSTFHSWCEPLITHPMEVYDLHADINKNEMWLAYLNSVKKYYTEHACAQDIPLPFMGFSLLDAACNILGAEKLFLYMYDAEETVDYLLDYITDLQIELFRSLRRQGIRLVNPFGFPCLYCNDLQMSSLSPYAIKRFIISRYQRAAKEAGGMILMLNCTDLELVKTGFLENDSIIGCGFDARMPLAEIRNMIGNKLFVISNYVHDPAFDKPTFKDGIWCNPIVQTYGGELTDVYRELGERCSMLIDIERYTIEEVCKVKEKLFY